MQLPIFTSELPVPHLVYRKCHKSTDIMPPFSPSKRRYDINTFVSISPRKITTYLKNCADNRIVNAMNHDYEREIGIKELPKENKANGIMSYKASHQINEKIDWMLLITKEKDAPQKIFASNYKWKINMLTVSLSAKQIHSDKVIKSKLLDHYILKLHRLFNVKNYIWRAETQYNGNIHFHIITDVFIPYKAAQFQWNKVQEKLGYIDEFEKKHKYRTPNSTDIHSIKKVKHLGKYLSKYMGKNSCGVVVPANHKEFKPPVGFFATYYKCELKKNTKFFRPVSGRLWGCSAQLSKLKKCRFRLTDIVEREIFEIRLKHPKSFRQHDYCRTYAIEVTEFQKYELPLLRGMFQDYYKTMVLNK